jgi:hypothetical protein
MLSETLKCKVVPVYVMKMYGQGGGIAPFIFNLRTRSCWWSSLRTGRFTTGFSVPSNRWIRSWVDTAAGLDALKKRSIPYTFRESNHSTSIIEPTA